MKKVIVVSIVALFLLSSCSLLLGRNNQPTTQDIQAAIEQTQAVQNAASTIVAQTQIVVIVEPTQTQTPTVEDTPVPPTPTMEPTKEVQAVAIQNANCRFGPASNFDYLGVLSEGSSAPIIGVNTEFGKWWKIILPDSTECWVIDEAISISGETASIQMVTSPKTPTPIPVPDWNGKWTIWLSGTFENKSSDYSTVSVQMVQTGDQLTYSFSLWGLHFTAYLTVSQDGMAANGILLREEDGETWNVQLSRVAANLNQFKGKWYWGKDTSLDGANCGSKNGAPMPNPCR